LRQSAAYSVGLDPQLGVFHADQYQKPVLAFDLIEPFRHWADRFLFGFVRDTDLGSGSFKITATGIFLDKKGKAMLIPRFLGYMDSRTTFNGRISTRRNHIINFAGDLAHQLFNTSVL
jgi:CRISPR-associated protein Cas1